MRWIWLVVLGLGLLACTKSVNVASAPAATPAPAAVISATIAPKPTLSQAEALTVVDVKSTNEPKIQCKATGDLNMRAEPSLNASVVGWLRTGQVVMVSAARAGEWREVLSPIGVQIGYAHGAYLDCK